MQQSVCIYICYNVHGRCYKGYRWGTLWRNDLPQKPLLLNQIGYYKHPVGCPKKLTCPSNCRRPPSMIKKNWTYRLWGNPIPYWKRKRKWNSIYSNSKTFHGFPIPHFIGKLSSYSVFCSLVLVSYYSVVTGLVSIHQLAVEETQQHTLEWLRDHRCSLQVSFLLRLLIISYLIDWFDYFSCSAFVQF